MDKGSVGGGITPMEWLGLPSTGMGPIHLDIRSPMVSFSGTVRRRTLLYYLFALHV